MLLASVLLVGCPALVLRELEDVDCNVREEGRHDPDLSPCLRASEFPECVPSAAFGGETDCLVLDADAVLCDDGGRFDMEVFLVESGHTLDCNGQVITHHPDGRRRSAVRAPYEYSVSDIAIRSCSILEVGRYGFDLKRFFRGEQLDGPMQGHERITIENSKIVRAEQIGIYVGQNARDVRIDGVEIREAFIGIYLEAGSTGSVIANVQVYDSFERGGIHIDSSAGNTIERSTFRGNQHGAILLYKNCGERTGQVCPNQRELDASDNIIRNNVFDGDSVVIAYRQFKLYGPTWCAGIDLLGHWRDRSHGNLVEGNQFYNQAILDIQDAPNDVIFNEFHGSILELGAPAPVGDDPIRFSGTIAGNAFDPDSWIGVVGDPGLALHDVHVAENVDHAGACYQEYRQLTSCRQELEGCYSAPNPIDSALCSAK